VDWGPRRRIRGKMGDLDGQRGGTIGLGEGIVGEEKGSLRIGPNGDIRVEITTSLPGDGIVGISTEIGVSDSTGTDKSIVRNIIETLGFVVK
jgi:hypothetical protein